MTMIWVPKKHIEVVAAMPKVKVGGFFKLDVFGEDGRLRRSTGWFPNLITNNGLDILGQQVDWNRTVAVGSGNAVPAFTDTTLQTIVASTTTQFNTPTNGVQATAPYFGHVTVTWQFPQGAAAGNLAEVGVGVTATNLLSRALILDGGGNPTTITVLANEFLNVTYTLNMYPPTTDVTGSVVLDGVSYNYTIRASRVATNSQSFGWAPKARDGAGNSTNPGPAVAGASTDGAMRTSNGAIGAITGSPTGTFAGSTLNGSGASTTYTPGAYNQNTTWTWGINDANLAGGIGAIEIAMGRSTVFSGFSAGGRGTFQIGFSPLIPKDNTKQLTLNFNLAWARV